MQNKDAIGGGRGWNIAIQERKICDVEIEIVTFDILVNGSVKLTSLPIDRSKSRKEAEVSLSCLRSRVQRDTSGPGDSSIWVVYGENIIDVSVCEIEPRCQPFPPG